MFSLPNSLEDSGCLIEMVRRNHFRNRPANDLLSGVSENPLSAPIPTRDDAVQRRADDRIICGFNEERHVFGRFEEMPISNFGPANDFQLSALSDVIDRQKNSLGRVLLSGAQLPGVEQHRAASNAFKV